MVRYFLVLMYMVSQASCLMWPKLNEVSERKELIIADDFSEGILSKYWAVEKDHRDSNAVAVKEGQLQLDAKYGLTVWLKKELQGNIMIEYDRTVVMADGPNDRVGDCNQFWMATGPGLETYRRTGAFNEYDALKLYYVGIGAHDNSVTRMRRYNGTADRKIILDDLKGSDYLLKPNKKMHIRIWVRNGISIFEVDGKTFFVYKDADPYRHGLFGLRTFSSRQRVDNFKVWQLQ